MPELLTGQRSRSLIQEGADRLTEAGVPEPRRQAVRIWAELSQAAQGDMLLDRGLDMDSAKAARYQHAIERRASGEPLPHVTGWTGFRHLSLRSDRRALIPRPETEGLVELLLQRARGGRVVDIGTGSGCIALSLALEGGFTDVVGIDRSAEALALAGENRELVGARVELVEGDLCAPVRAGAFDALISNPPYLTAAEHAGLDPSVRDWEPAIALKGGEDGLEATARLLDQGRDVLRAGGWLALEVDCARAGSAAHLASGLGWEDVEIHLDLFGRERYLLARRSNIR
jgi:release factor glutamine methyltransferase